MTRRLVVCLVLLGIGAPAPAPASRAVAEPDLTRVERQVYLMGTLATLVVYDVDRLAGLVRLEAMLDSLERTESNLSTWRVDSVVSALNRHPVQQPFKLPVDLCGLFPGLIDWWRDTGGAFDPAIGALGEAWGLQGGGRIPTEEELRVAMARTGLEHMAFDDGTCTVTRRRDVTIDTGAFGKGYALDRVVSELGAAPAWLIDLGGQVMAHDRPPDARAWRVGLAHPDERQLSILDLDLAGGSLSTSGGSERDRLVDGVRVGHLLDPHTGRPAAFDGSVVVWHEEAQTADILSTALYVMGVEKGLIWAETRRLAVCFLLPVSDVAGGVRVRATAAFRDKFPEIASVGPAQPN